jgi:hypothetical protein
MAAIKLGATLKGADELQAALNKLNDRVKGAAPHIVDAAAIVIMDNSVRRTPVDTGDLRRSSFVDPPTTSAGGRYTNIQFGYARSSADPAHPYALIQHENDDYYHRVGEAHFLLNAVYAMTPRVRALIAKLTKNAMRP